MQTIEVGGRLLGPGAPCFVIAEAGVNHNGDLALAKALIDAAAGAGADAVKFQTWITEKLVAPDAELAAYQERNVADATSQFAMLKELELPHEAFRELQSHAAARGILFLSTPDEEESADFLDALGVPLFKIGSAELDNLPFLEHVARKGRPMIASTGMGTLAESQAAASAIRCAGNGQLILLHCVSDYPAAPADCNLRAMETLARECACPVGFSDHTTGIHIAAAAVALGACVIEKHLTTDKALPGPDHRCSLDPDEFRAMVEAIREVEAARGDGVKQPTPGELATREVVRKRLVAVRALPAGKIVAADDFQPRRAARGLPASEAGRVIGRRLRVACAAGASLEAGMLEAR